MGSPHYMAVLAQEREYLPDARALLDQINGYKAQAANLDPEVGVGGYMTRLLQGPAANTDEPLYDTGKDVKNIATVVGYDKDNKVDNLFLGANLDRVRDTPLTRMLYR